MVLYTCQRCLKEFKKKDDYIKHSERRKYPCQIKDTLKNDNTPLCSNNEVKNSENPPNKIMIIEQIDNNLI
jgi:hypothetical protein